MKAVANCHKLSEPDDFTLCHVYKCVLTHINSFRDGPLITQSGETSESANYSNMFPENGFSGKLMGSSYQSVKELKGAC